MAGEGKPTLFVPRTVAGTEPRALACLRVTEQPWTGQVTSLGLGFHVNKHWLCCGRLPAPQLLNSGTLGDSRPALGLQPGLPGVSPGKAPGAPKACQL